MPSSLRIAQEHQLRPIQESAAAAGLEPDEVEPYGRYKAKIDLSVLDLIGLEPGGCGDLLDRAELVLLRDPERRGHRRVQIRPFGRVIDAEDTTNISPWLGQAPLGSRFRL